MIYIDPETRRVLLTEIAYQRTCRDGYRYVAADDAEPYGVQYKARLRAEGCCRAIRALRDVWAGLVAVERRHAENEMAVVG
jgi:hypothetical protein